MGCIFAFAMHLFISRAPDTSGSGQVWLMLCHQKGCFGKDSHRPNMPAYFLLSGANHDSFWEVNIPPSDNYFPALL
ncbi:hypothetical protein OIDMADRAFT_17621, partial [Oidiodendron maius Zn]